VEEHPTPDAPLRCPSRLSSRPVDAIHNPLLIPSGTVSLRPVARKVAQQTCGYCDPSKVWVAAVADHGQFLGYPVDPDAIAGVPSLYRKLVFTVVGKCRDDNIASRTGNLVD